MIIINKVKCKKCGDVLESKHVHDFKACKCYYKTDGAMGIYIDGGKEYLKRGGDPIDVEELSVVKNEKTLEEKELRLNKELKIMNSLLSAMGRDTNVEGSDLPEK